MLEPLMGTIKKYGRIKTASLMLILYEVATFDSQIKTILQEHTAPVHVWMLERCYVKIWRVALYAVGQKLYHPKQKWINGIDIWTLESAMRTVHQLTKNWPVIIKKEESLMVCSVIIQLSLRASSSSDVLQQEEQTLAHQRQSRWRSMFLGQALSANEKGQNISPHTVDHYETGPGLPKLNEILF